MSIESVPYLLVGKEGFIGTAEGVVIIALIAVPDNSSNSSSQLMFL